MKAPATVEKTPRPVYVKLSRFPSVTNPPLRADFCMNPGEKFFWGAGAVKKERDGKEGLNFQLSWLTNRN